VKVDGLVLALMLLSLLDLHLAWRALQRRVDRVEDN